MIPSKPDLELLRSFLARPNQPEGTLSLDEVYGLLFAFAGAPEAVPPSVMLSAIFDGRSPEFDTQEQVQAVVGALLALSNEINAQVSRRAPVLPPHVVFRDDPIQNLHPDAPGAAWSRGFARGLGLVQAGWNAWLPDELFDTWSAAVLVLTLFSSPERAERFRDDFVADGTTLEQVAEEAIRTFTAAMEGYVHLGRSILEARFEDAQEDATGAERVSGTGRNDPCPCGSGKKFERCCGATLH